MTQLLLPLLSSEITYINGRVTVYQREGEWTYFLGDYPIYSHKADDLCMFRLTAAQLIDSGACRQAEIIKTFGVSKSSVIRAQKKYRDGGSKAFFTNKQSSKKAELFEQIEQYEQDLNEIKAELKTIKKHVAWEKLNEKDKFFQLLPGRKRLMDTVKMVAYRAETSMASILKDDTTDMAAARRLMQDLYNTEADIFPQPKNSRLFIRVHNASRPAANRKIKQLFKYLNEAEMYYPGTQLRLHYELASKDI